MFTAHTGAETIQGRKLFKGGTICGNTVADFGFTPLIRCPPDPRPQECLEKQNYPLSSNLVVWCIKIGLKTKKVQKTSVLSFEAS